MKLTNFFWGTLSIIIAFGLLYGLYPSLLSLANGMPSNEMKLLGYIAIAVVIVFLVLLSPISNFIADDEGRV